MVLTTQVSADELRPVYIELTQKSQDQWSLIWKASARSSIGRQGQVSLPNICTSDSPQEVRVEDGKISRSETYNCSTPILGNDICLEGLENSSTDALLRFIDLENTVKTFRLTTKEHCVRIKLNTRDTFTVLPDSVAKAYLILGIEHILFGFDHLLFVLSLVLLISNWSKLFTAITAFTFAHSITLVGTTLGWFSLAQKPVEAIIALSIIYLALETLKPDSPSRLAPWVAACFFGLLHGFGFAGALAEIGLPINAIPLALLSFNIGVEIGQLAIIFLALTSYHILHKISPNLKTISTKFTAYGIGCIASFWLLQRLSVFG